MRRLWQPLSLMVRRWLTYQFVADEARSLRGVRYNPVSLGRKDQEMLGFLRWAAALPQGTPSRNASVESPRRMEKPTP